MTDKKAKLALFGLLNAVIGTGSLLVAPDSASAADSAAMFSCANTSCEPGAFVNSCFYSGGQECRVAMTSDGAVYCSGYSDCASRDN